MRRLAVICVMLAMAFVLAANVVPHHHHSALVCFEHEDEHHHDSHGSQEHEDIFCVANENFTASARLEVEKPFFSFVTVLLPPPVLKLPLVNVFSSILEFSTAERLPSPPFLAGSSLRAPPVLLFS